MKKNCQSEKEFFEGIVNTVREQTYTYILDMLSNCKNCNEAKKKMIKELHNIHKKNIEYMKKQINGS